MRLDLGRFEIESESRPSFSLPPILLLMRAPYHKLGQVYFLVPGSVQVGEDLVDVVAGDVVAGGLKVEHHLVEVEAATAVKVDSLEKLLHFLKVLFLEVCTTSASIPLPAYLFHPTSTSLTLPSYIYQPTFFILHITAYLNQPTSTSLPQPAYLYLPVYINHHASSILPLLAYLYQHTYTF